MEHWYLVLSGSWTMFSHPTRGSFFSTTWSVMLILPLVSYRSIFTTITLAIMTYLTPSNYFLFTPLYWIQALICINRFVFLFFPFHHLFSIGAHFSQSGIYFFFPFKSFTIIMTLMHFFPFSMWLYVFFIKMFFYYLISYKNIVRVVEIEFQMHFGFLHPPCPHFYS